MKRILITCLAIVGLPIVAHGVSICIAPGAGGASGTELAEVYGNRALWFVGNVVVGEAHCTNTYILTPETTVDEFEAVGNRCWCRTIQVAAPNGYLANRSGAWVNLNLGSFGVPACLINCAKSCASGFVQHAGFRRVLLTSPYREIN